MKVYIDNNVLVDYDEGRIVLPTNNDINYYYSYVHIEELIELHDRLLDFKDRRLKTIETLTMSNYIQNDENNVLESFVISPNTIFNLCMSPLHVITNTELKQMQKVFLAGHDRNELIEAWGIDIKRLNNYSAKDIVSEFGTSLSYYLMHTAETSQCIFQSYFNFLDMIGFWRDKHSDRSNMARSYDANHAYFATYCDFFVTNDKRTMNKSNVVYQTFGYKTVAISYDGFIKLTSENPILHL